jgi:hypothetical protein
MLVGAQRRFGKHGLKETILGLSEPRFICGTEETREVRDDSADVNCRDVLYGDPLEEQV